ncbi:Ethanolamine-phosphate cytidylyltransferase [Dissophora globulifera]|uniref:ethanolamine-phosphate cytidylyltransferase n=1 Tax=Dissophora globulifera TaxID=979702 RepID=A0A9P6RVU1_9FUNG|nr:Ethanolamine-phosphate cytidylyltransferase [Dissophora globulifera]
MNSATTTRMPRKPIRIWVDGCYDVMHHGHFNSLRQAKAMGDIVVAGVHSDAEIMQHKGPPIMNEDERVEAVSACKWVDEVVPNAPYLTSLEWMDRYNCDFCVHGDDVSTLADGTDSYKHVKDVGRYRECRRTKGVSTTDLVSRMLLMTQDQSTNGRALDEASPGREAGAVQKMTTRHSNGINTSNGFHNDHNSHGDTDSTALQVLETARKVAQFSYSNQRTPQKGDKVVYVDGAFDLFHIGHIDFLRRASALGDFLVVGVHDDQTVRARKGAHHPLLSLHERVLSVLACRYVGDVVIGAPYGMTEEVLNGDYSVDFVARGHSPESEASLGDQDPYRLAKSRGIFVQLDEVPAHSVTTESIVHRILDNRAL